MLLSLSLKLEMTRILKGL